MTTTMMVFAVLVAKGLMLALYLNGRRWRKLYDGAVQMAQELATALDVRTADLAMWRTRSQQSLGDAAAHLSALAVERDQVQATATYRLRSLAEVMVERDRLRAALAEAAAIVGRRPPRRKWLARARRVAQVAAAWA